MIVKSPECIKEIDAAIKNCSSTQLIQVLHHLQTEFKHISRPAMLRVAELLALPVSQVEAVVEFYAFFHTMPRGEYEILLSNCPCCGYLTHTHNWLNEFSKRLKLAAHTTRDDGLVTLDEASCIGLCDHGASLMINGRSIAGLNEDKVHLITDLIEQQIKLDDWPNELFEIKHHIYQKNLLLNEPPVLGQAMQASLNLGTEALLNELTISGLRGRGGAGFSTAKKWQFCREAQGDAHYVVCNADEGEPGTFKDRVLLLDHAHNLFEGMSICAQVIGAKQGFLYLRAEYRFMLPQLEQVLAERRQLGLLNNFNIEIVFGAGAYICGEESALIESLEGKRGVPRIRPPFPVTSGYLNQPTVVNNVETFVAASYIALHGGANFAAHGTTQSGGTKLFSISGDCPNPGIYELSFGLTVREVLALCGAKPDEVQAIQVSGPSGTLISAADFDRKLCYEDLSIGGSFMIFNQQRDILKVVQQFAHFFAHESCGFCTPCRVGTTLLHDRIERVMHRQASHHDYEEIKELCQLVKHNSHCGLGQTAANPIIDAIQRFPDKFEQHLLPESTPHFNLEAALAISKELR